MLRSHLPLLNLTLLALLNQQFLIFRGNLKQEIEKRLKNCGEFLYLEGSEL